MSVQLDPRFTKHGTGQIGTLTTMGRPSVIFQLHPCLNIEGGLAAEQTLNQSIGRSAPDDRIIQGGSIKTGNKDEIFILN